MRKDGINGVTKGLRPNHAPRHRRVLRHSSKMALAPDKQVRVAN